MNTMPFTMSTKSYTELPTHEVPSHSKQKDMSSVCSVILAGGQGTRLFPLTQARCKPALLFGGRHLLIDIPISNALHANIQHNFIVTQFLSSSLHRHIFHTYRSTHFSHGHIEILGAEQKVE